MTLFVGVRVGTLYTYLPRPYLRSIIAFSSEEARIWEVKNNIQV